ncbi:hypothetical protein [Fibrella aquatilis]|uniref:Uncharacterized protein n=1 Tax=Fibrella aquatilis TaxID=2817059 RepID=A0A939JY94_9BACT|nr:hypothetical protein [Fibrella aquatilis]MBO0929636.1 hypothetical protein [Fibrella aquatilis]
MLAISVNGLLIGFWAAFFFLGSEESLRKLLIEKGPLFLWLGRFIGFTLLGAIFSLGIAFVSLLMVLLTKKADINQPLRVFVVSVTVQALCALCGSLLFMYH